VRSDAGDLGGPSNRGFIAQIQRGLELAGEAGIIARRPTEPLTHLIYGGRLLRAQRSVRSAGMFKTEPAHLSSAGRRHP